MQKRNKIRQLLAMCVVVSVACLVAVIVIRTAGKKVAGPALPSRTPNIDLALQQLHYTETRNGVKQWDLVADKAEYDKAREVATLTGIRLVVIGTRQVGDVTLTAERGEYLAKTKEIRLAGNIVAKSTTGMEFTTTQATYFSERSLLESSARVRFVNDRLTVEGVGMQLNSDTKNLRLMNDVTAEVRPGRAK